MEQQIEVKKESIYYNGLNIGTVEAGNTASASIVGNAPNQKLNLVLPIGPEGSQGPQGIQGIQGEVGPQGPQGIQGIQGEKGEKGDTGSQGPQGIQGEKGDKGERGEKGDTGPQGIPGPTGPKGADGVMTFADLTDEQKESLKGKDGVSPVINVTSTDSGHTVTVTDLNGTKTVNINNGVDGTNGQNGKDGLTTSISVNGETYTHENGKIVLPNYELKTNTGNSIALNIDSSTFVMTLELKNSAGEVISAGTVDLPLETMVVNASYDNTTKEVVLILQSGTTTRFSVADLVSGLAKSNEVYTKEEVDNKLNGYSTFSGSYNDLKDKPIIPTKTSDLTNDAKYIKVFIASTEEEMLSLSTADPDNLYATLEE